MRRPLSGDGDVDGFGDLKVFSGSAHPQLTKEIADFLGIQAARRGCAAFPDTEVSFRSTRTSRHRRVHRAADVVPGDEHLMRC